MTHLSLFSGIGGLDLAAEWAGMETVGQCEWADYPAKVLERHWPDVPRWKDIKTLTGESFYERTGRRTVDVVSGGFPCQPFSVAGKQRGKDDHRYLWPEMVRVVKELRPAWVVGENVAGIIRMGLPGMLAELEACGYRTRVFCIPACAVGARHRRERVAIVGHAEHDGRPAAEVAGRTGKAEKSQEGAEEACKPPGTGGPGNHGGMGGRPGTLENTDGIRLRRPQNGPEQPWGTETVRGSENVECGECRKGRGGRGAEPGMGGMADGFPCRMDGYWDTEPLIPRLAGKMPWRAKRLEALGNAVVPQQFYPVFRAIVEIRGMEREMDGKST